VDLAGTRRRDQPGAPAKGGSEQGVGLGMVLVAPAEERDPGAAIDEQAVRCDGEAVHRPARS
jgi:hypothetical protein